MIIKMNKIAPVINSRHIVEVLVEIAASKKRDDNFVFDFSGIEFISRSAMHELVTFSKKHRIQMVNMSNSVKKMSEVVKNTDYSSRDATFQVKRVSLKSLAKA